MSMTLRASQLGQRLNDQELALLCEHNQIATFASNSVILQQGKSSEHLYYILDGTINIAAKILSEGVTHLETLGPGNFLGEISFLVHGLTATSAATNSEVRCLMISQDYFSVLALLYPETKYKIVRLISQQVAYRLKKMQHKVSNLLATSEMVPKSIFGVFIESLTKPVDLSLQEANLSQQEVANALLYTNLTDAEKQQLLSHARVIKAAKNCTLIKEGQTSIACFIVIHGAVQTSFIQQNKVAKLSVIGPMTLFASMSCIDHELASSTNFSTCEQSVLLLIKQEDLYQLQKNHPRLWFKVYDLICKSMVELERSMDKLDVRLGIENYNR